ncbi:MAG: sugar phosphate isomerase/epimerase family protein [Armatimonadota bacterium]
MMRLGLVTYNLAHDWNLQKLISECESAGFEGVELRTTHGHGVEPALSDREREAVRETFENTDIVLWGLGTTCEYHSPDPDDVNRNIQETFDFVDLAKDVGARGVKVRPNGLPEDVPVDDTLQQIGEALNQCGDYAADAGVEIWLEVHGRETSHVPYIRTIMDVADHDTVKVCWNSNDTDIVDGSITENFELLKDKIGSVHMRALHLDYPWHELFAGLKSIGYEGFCLAEIPESDDPERVMLYYRALWDCLTASA